MRREALDNQPYVWFDIPPVDLDRAIQFYSAVLLLGTPGTALPHEGNLHLYKGEAGVYRADGPTYNVQAAATRSAAEQIRGTRWSWD